MIDTLVIGAGISGLTTAFHLARGGKRVAVLEASSRVGGCLETKTRSEEHTSELQSQSNLVCRLLLEKKKKQYKFQARTVKLNYIVRSQQPLTRDSVPLPQ